MYQMTIDDYDQYEEVTNPKPLLTLEALDYLNKNHYGLKETNCSMEELSMYLNVDKRTVRKIIEYLTLNTPIVIGSTPTGYFIASNEEEVEIGNKMLKSRVKSSLRRLRANGFINMNWVYTTMNDLKDEYPIHPEGQINAKGEIESYINKKRLLAEQDK